MKIVVVGATGGIGREVVRQALGRGDHVTAVVRDPAGLDPSARDHPALQTVVASVTAPDELAAALVGRDAVVSALGTRPGGHPPICAPAARALVRAMESAGVARLAIVSASGLAIDAGDGIITRTVLKPLVQRILRKNFADLTAMEQVVRASGLQWTIVRPPRLTDRPGTRTYRTAIDLNVRRGFVIARADVADAILAGLADDALVGHVLGLGN